ncbi:Eco57I restriction-modification methylase domain-containing protein [Rhizobium sp. CAU 1783]
MRFTSPHGRKRLGQYFTPEAEAAWLCEWAIREPHERVLEPSVGEGALVKAAMARIDDLGGASSEAICGYDIDGTVISTLQQSLDPPLPGLFKHDFLKLKPASLGPFDVVLANPPFTRNHQIAEGLRRELKQTFPIRGAAGLWVYFLLHAQSFLRPGGRLAFIVPGAATFTDYAADLVGQLRLNFRDVQLKEMRSKPDWTGAADERGVFLLADGYQINSSITVAPKRSPQRSRAFDALDTLKLNSRPLSEYGRLSIGAVTGANKTFLLTRAEVEEFGIPPDALLPIVSRAKQVRGLQIHKEDLEELAAVGHKTWLLYPAELGPKDGPVRRRLATISPSVRRNTVWLNKRKPWWRVGIEGSCDAVFTYMNDLGPNISLVESGIFCTNTLHKIQFKTDISCIQRKIISLSMITTFAQLAAEAIGRGYGGGVLKFELKDARRFPILLPPSSIDESSFDLVDRALKYNRFDEARELADELLMPSIIGEGWRTSIVPLRKMLSEARASRRAGAARALSLTF